MLKAGVHDLLSGPQTGASALVGRLLSPREIESVAGGHEQCYGRETGDFTKYIQQEGCGEYGQGGS